MRSSHAASSVVHRLVVLTFCVWIASCTWTVYRLAELASPRSALGRLLGKNPCDEPIRYSLTAVDARFHVSREAVRSALQRASEIWNAAAGRPVFVEDEAHSTLPVRLIFDYRQEATQKLAALGITIEHDRATYDTLKHEFDALKSSIDAGEKDLQRSVVTHNAAVQSLDAEIARWNDRGGAPESVYEKLVVRQDALRLEEERIARQQDALNEQIDDLNAVVPALNQQAKLLNLAGVEYQTMGQPISQAFEEGVYSADTSGTRIDIFQFENKNRLIRVFAHELGHALDLDHVADPEGIMYYLNRGSGDAITDDDRRELRRACGG